MGIKIFLTVLAFITKARCYHKPILNCMFQDTLTRVCASNGRTYDTECDLKQDKLFVDPKLRIMHLGKCNNRVPKEKHWYVEEKPSPRYIIKEQFESPNDIIEETQGEKKLWVGILKNIIQGKGKTAKDILDNVKNTIESIVNYDVKKLNKKIIFKKDAKKGCIYCPRNK